MTPNPADHVLGRSATATANHDQLFGDRVSTFAQTDPELVAFFDDWAYDEVPADADALDDSLDRPTRLLVQLAATAAAGGLGEFKALAAAAITHGGVTPVQLRELAYQTMPYLGMARAYDYLHAANEALTAAGVDLPLTPQAASGPDTRTDIGKTVQEHIVGAGQVDRMHTNAPDDAKHFQRYLTANCFGDVVARQGLDLPTRELLTFAMLAGFGGADAQLKGHVTGNLNVGNTRPRLLAVLTHITPFIGYPRTLNALTAINDTAPARSCR